MRHLALPLALLSLLLVACGGGGGDGGDERTATELRLDTVEPPGGPTAGGAAITLIGAGFLDSLPTVRIGGVLATEVQVLTDTRLVARTPPGTVGVVDVSVESALGEETSLNAYTYFPPPNLTQVVAGTTRDGIAAGLTTGGTKITLVGNRFQRDDAGPPQVLVGGEAATQVIVLDDNVIEAVTSAHLPGIVDVEVVTNNGSARLAPGFFYRPPLLWAAEGKASADPKLFLIDATDASAIQIGSGLGFRVEGMAMDDDGTLWGVSEGFLASTSTLLQINTTSGQATAIRELHPSNSSSPRADVRDLVIIDGELYGWVQNFRRPAHIDIDTGGVTLMEFADFGTGEGIAMSPDGDVYLAIEDSNEILRELDLASGVATPGATMTGNQTNAFVNGMTFLDGVLFASEAQRNTTNNTEFTGPSDLIRIDPLNGTVIFVGALPDDIDALAANFR